MKGIKNMEINRQLFEDVLSGKLEGKFVFRNIHNIYGVELKPNHTCIQKASKDGFYIIRMPSLLFNAVNADGKSVYGYTKHKGESENDLNYDIIDFIPEIDMKENKLTIEIPNNKIVDWDESKKQNKIVLKDKQLTYEDICKKLFENKEFFFTNNTGVIESSSPVSVEYLTNAVNNSTSYHQLECILAKNKLANTAKYLNSLSDETTADYYIYNGFNLNVQQLLEPHFNLGLIVFKTKELAQQAIEILGKETVKLALEPLGI